MTAPRIPAVEATSLDLAGSVAVLLCTFRLCDWTSPDTRTLSPDEQDQTIAAHLIDAHRRELSTLARLAREAGLIL